MTRTPPSWRAPALVDPSVVGSSPIHAESETLERARSHDPILDGPAWRNRLLRVTDAAEYMAVSRSKIYALMRTGELSSLTVGGSRRLTLGTVVDYVDRRRTEG